MTNFNFSDLAPAGDQAKPFVFDQIVQDGGSPTIWFLPATEDNKPFFNDNLRRNAAKATGGRRKAKALTPDGVKAAREEDRASIAKFCAKRWDKVLDAEGKPVEFSQEEVLGFLQALPDWYFDDLRVWITEPTNFIGTAAPVDGAPLGESSPPA